jgi:pimeloyl-ACP methyl ester carboxylesterase
MARDVVRLLRHLGVERAHLVGLSMGGMVAQQFALDYPYAVASLVLAATSCGTPPEFAAAAQEQLRFIETHSMPEIAAARITTAFTDGVNPLMRGHLIETVALNDRDTYARAARAVFGFSLRERVGEIAAPTLVVIGEGDRTFPMPLMEDVAQRIRGARMVRIAGAGHLCNMERPQEFNRAVLEFLGV